MRWRLELELRHGDPRLIAQVLAPLRVALETSDDGLFISGPMFESLPTSSEVFATGDRLIDAVLLAAGSQIDCEIGSRLEERIEGSAARVHRRAKLRGHSVLIMGGDISVSISEPANLTDAEREALRRQREDDAIRQAAEPIGIRAVAAWNSDRATRVLRLLAQDALDTTAMNAVAEIIEADLRGATSAVASNAEFTRFHRSINHPATFGDTARHVESNEEPHPDPMTRAEAEAFIRRAAQDWLRLVADRSP